MPKFLSAFAMTLLMCSSAYADGSQSNYWNIFKKHVKNAKQLKFTTPQGKSTYLKNEKLRLEIDTENGGYLNIINLNSDGSSTLLFPNKQHPDNKVSAGHLSLPTSKMDFEMVTEAPFGKSLVMALLTPTKVDLIQSDKKSMNAESDLNTAVFKQLSATEMGTVEKSFGVRANKSKNKAGMIELLTCETAESC